MQFRRRFWASATVGALLTTLAVVFARPLLLVAGAGLGGWLIAEQLLFVRALDATADGLSLRVEPSKTTAVTGEAITVTIAAQRADRSRLGVAVEIRPPVAAVGATRRERTVELDGRTGEAETTFDISFPVAGAQGFDAALVTVTDRAGLFRERLTRDLGRTVTVEPRSPRDVHVGRGGERVATAYGEHEAGRIGTGLDPAELREYVPGDPANRIDWKATARLDEPYVREYEPETDRETVLFVAHGESTGTGRAGETALDYLRLVALAFVNDARRRSDPLGFYAVDDDGVTRARPPTASADQYATVRRLLQNLRPTDWAGTHPTRTIDPAAARRLARRLGGDSAFERTLRPYLGTTDAYVSQLDGDPLVAAVRTYLPRLRGRGWTVVLADDSRPVALREAVKLARQGDERVLVFVAPLVLFEPSSLADLERAYERYREFENHRRDLERLDRVSAFEVGPGDRVDAILAANRQARRTGTRQSP